MIQHLISETLNPASHRTKKMFVGGLASDVTSDQFRAYFEQWGRVQDSVVMIVCVCVCVGFILLFCFYFAAYFLFSSFLRHLLPPLLRAFALRPFHIT
jgi:hypothetical protein